MILVCYTKNGITDVQDCMTNLRRACVWYRPKSQPVSWHLIRAGSCKLHCNLNIRKRGGFFKLTCRFKQSLQSPCGLTNLIWLSTEIVSFMSAEKLAACLQHSYRTSSQVLIFISSNQKVAYSEHELVYLPSLIGLWMVSVCSSKLAYICFSLTSTSPWWNESVCVGRKRGR